MNYTLLIWNESPDQIELFLIPEIEANKYRKFLDEAHDKMINSDDMNDGLRFLNTALGTEEFEDDSFEEYLGIWKDYRVKNTENPILDTKITRVYSSGFVM